MSMFRSLTLLTVLLATLISGCHITVVSTPRPDSAQVAATDSVPADTVPATTGVPQRPYRPAPAPRPEPPQVAILTPVQWAAGARDTAASPVRQTFTVTGRVHHDATVEEVRVNGQAAILARGRDGGTSFVATLEPTRAGIMEVRVEARAAAGTGVATYFLRVTPQVATPTPTRPQTPARPPATPPTTPPTTPPVTPPTTPPVTPPTTPPVTPPTTPPVTPPTTPPTTPPVTPPTTPPGVDTAAVATGTAADSAWAERSRWAVVIGVSDYADGDVPSRLFAARDAHAFRDFLRSPASGPGGIPAARTLVLADAQATRGAVQGALTDFLRGVGPDDVVLIFLAATAMPDPERPNGAYLLPYDARPGALPATALTVQWLIESLRAVPAHQKIVFADILQAPGEPRGRGRGAAAPAPSQNLVHRALESAGPRDRSLVVLTAVGPGNQAAQEGERWGGGHGAFSHYLLEGLHGEADGDDDGIVTLTEIIRHTRDAVRRGTGNAQSPGLSAASYDRHWPMARVLER
jgi:hypothetical protein